MRGCSWRRLLALYGASVAALAALVMTVFLVLDPYDTGRFALFGEHGVPKFGQPLAMASIGRRADIDTAILGNSTLQLLDPARLGAATGRRAVSLATPGTGPLEQLVLARWVLRRHPPGAITGLVIGIDRAWCRGDGRLEIAAPYPFWLYSDNPLEYALGLARLKTFEAIERKVKLILGGGAQAPRNGYYDYESGRGFQPMMTAAAIGLVEAPLMPPSSAASEFAALPRLRALFAELAPGTAVVLVVPPRHRSVMPAPGSAEEAVERACRDAFAALARSRPRTLLLDFSLRAAWSDDDSLWWDPIHYRAAVARQMEASIAAALLSP